MKFDWSKFRTYFFVVLGTVAFMFILQQVFKKKDKPESYYEQRLKKSEQELKRLRRDSLNLRQEIARVKLRTDLERKKEEEKINRYIEANENLNFKNYSDSELDSARNAILSRY